MPDVTTTDPQAVLTGGATDPAALSAEPQAGQDPAASGGAANEPNTSDTLTPEEAAELRRSVEEAKAEAERLAAERAEFEKTRAQLEESRRQVDDALAFQRALQADPALAERLRRAVAEHVYGGVAGQTPEQPAGYSEQPDATAAAFPPQVIEAMRALAQHGMLTEAQIKELKAQTEQLASFRQEIQAQQYRADVTRQVDELLSKYPERYRFADRDLVLATALDHPEEAKRVGIAHLLKADAEANRARYLRWKAEEEAAAQAAGARTTVPATSAGSPAPARALAGDERRQAMLAMLNRLEAGASA